VYLTALEHGLTPDSVREDAPITIKGWNPENYSRRYLGEVTLTQALSKSLNTVAVRLGQEVGPKAIIRTAHRLGIASDLEPNASIALGTSEVTPLELVTAYTPFANGGIGVQPHVITRVRTANGKQLYVRRNANNGRVIEPQYVAMMNSMLEQTLQKGGTAEKADLPGWQAAGKTGTSQDWRDAWFIGYTSDLVAGVWLGNDDNEPTKKSSGGNLPVEIWSRFMKAALQGVPVAGLPSGEWRNPEVPTADAPALPPLAAAVGAPLTINRGGEAVLSAPSGRIPATWNAPVPPAPIPNVGAGASVAPAARDKSLLSKLFGAT
jgi:penicillin-binding protein 1A